ncbi:MAG TPA: PASTA domain-containing protein [Thermoleophilia bacterium]|nr:PASTA domain-containing protein [Thermoleophilia bacterium]
MTEPIYAQRYRTRRRLPPGRAEAAYAGQDAQGRPVVVTVVRPLDADAFLRTMGVVASVRHLDLAPVVDAGREGADCFVVTEDAGGEDVAALAVRGPLPVADAALIGASAAAGLAALHERGVVHGGVDPTTVVRGDDGAVRLTGAGLAGAFPPPDLRPGTPPDIARSLSPEEVTGRAPTPASDVYRLGLVTYLLLTGRHAFDGADGNIVAQEQIDGVVQPPQLLNPEVPPAVAQIVARALEKDPGARGTAAQFQADIERVLESAVVQPAPVKPRSKAWLWVVGLFAVLAVALAVAWAAGAFDSTALPEAVTVPDVTGMTEAKAGAVLQEAGLKPGETTEVQRDGSVAGTVVSQTPAPGEEVDKGTAVALEVAAAASPSPPTSVAVPGVVGQAESDAVATLTAAGFVVVVAKAESESVPAGAVVEQSPGEGVMAEPGAKVNLIVSTGAPTPTPTSSSSP